MSTSVSEDSSPFVAASTGELGQVYNNFNIVPPVNVSPPEKLNFSLPAAWPVWRKRFERYMSVSGQLGKSEKEKIDILTYIMGEEAEEVMVQFQTVPTTYDEALDSFESYFIPRRNVIFERFKFNSRFQKPGESIDSFITNLHLLAEYCDYGNLKEDLIRDRIVVGMLDSKTSERLQLKDKLTLQECVLQAKQAELQANQNKELQGSQRYIGKVQVPKDKTAGSSNAQSNSSIQSGGGSHFAA